MNFWQSACDDEHAHTSDVTRARKDAVYQYMVSEYVVFLESTCTIHL